MLNSPLIRPAISWGKRGIGGGTLGSHNSMRFMSDFPNGSDTTIEKKRPGGVVHQCRNVSVGRVVHGDRQPTPPGPPMVSLNKALLNPYFWGGTLGGGRLTSHELLGGFLWVEYGAGPPTSWAPTTCEWS